MGGCATKPKVSKAEEAGGEAPVQAPETVKEEAVVVESKEKDVVVIGDEPEKKIEGDDHTVKEIVDDEDKRKSLSHLFQVIIIYLIKHVYNYILLRLQLFHNHRICFITLKTNYYRSGSSLMWKS